MNTYTSRAICMTSILLFLVAIAAVIFNTHCAKRKLKVYEKKQ